MIRYEQLKRGGKLRDIRTGETFKVMVVCGAYITVQFVDSPWNVKQLSLEDLPHCEVVY